MTTVIFVQGKMDRVIVCVLCLLPRNVCSCHGTACSCRTQRTIHEIYQYFQTHRLDIAPPGWPTSSHYLRAIRVMHLYDNNNEEEPQLCARRMTLGKTSSPISPTHVLPEWMRVGSKHGSNGMEVNDIRQFVCK